MWDDLFLPQTCQNNQINLSWKISMKATLITSSLFSDVIYLVSISISFSLEAEGNISFEQDLNAHC